MKTMAILVVLALSASICNAQEVIQLKEARVGFSPAAQNISQEGNSLSVHIRENYSGEFLKDPIAFMHNHFDIHEVINALEEKEYDTYHVSFKCEKGVLIADYDIAGNLTGTFLKLNNIAIPNSLKHQLYRDYKGWEMVKNQHIASESRGITKKDLYKITMKKGNRKLNLKINAEDIGTSRIAALN